MHLKRSPLWPGASSHNFLVPSHNFCIQELPGSWYLCSLRISCLIFYIVLKRMPLLPTHNLTQPKPLEKNEQDLLSVFFQTCANRKKKIGNSYSFSSQCIPFNPSTFYQSQISHYKINFTYSNQICLGVLYCRQIIVSNTHKHANAHRHNSKKKRLLQNCVYSSCFLD